MNNLHVIAQQLVEGQKGILAADESVATMTKRLDAIHVESTPATRSLWREIMLTTTGIEEYISGIILFDETLRGVTPGGHKITDLTASKHILPGIKVDQGTVPLAGSPLETDTKGLDGLARRFEEYRTLGAVFAKWRAVYTVSDAMPTEAALEANAEGLARYALCAQQAGIVPIVEPEVLVLAGEHTMEVSQKATERALKTVFAWLDKLQVDLSGMLLKPNMVLPAKSLLSGTTETDIAKQTVETLLAHVPKEVPGIVFLSGGLNPDQSTTYLSQMNTLYAGRLPWALSFSYGRALQQEGLAAWHGKSENVAQAQKVFIERARKVSEATKGR